VLAAAGLRDRLPKTRALAERPYTQPSDATMVLGIKDMVGEARDEIHEALEQESDRAHADDKLGF
jgi:hypothetical protein